MMSQQERWQLGGNAPEIYERYLVPAIFGPWAPIVIAQAGLQAGESVLDVACGTGVVARLAVQHVGASGHVTGLDINPGMLAIARSLTPAQGATVEWREGDAMTLPFSDETFNVAFSQLGLQYFADRLQALREIQRVIIPEGRLVVLVWRAIAHSPGFAALAEALDQHVSPAAGAVMRAPFVFGDCPEELRTLLTDAGFREVMVRSDVRMVRFASPEALVQYQVAGSPLAGHVVQADDAAREALIRDVTAAMKDYLNDDGVAFPIEGHIAVGKK
jgi:ubiquinone/menaquinone biosynthesis C-methylase UbiE